MYERTVPTPHRQVPVVAPRTPPTLLGQTDPILGDQLTETRDSLNMGFMTLNCKYQADDLVVVVWPRQSAPRVLAGEITWQEAVSADWAKWAIEAEKAERATVLIAIHDEVVEGAWRVTGATHHPEIPMGKTRMINRSHFETVDDPRLAYLVKTLSWLGRRRNPQTTVELRDLPGADTLIAATELPAHGLVQLGQYTLVVSEDGTAELRIPPGALFTVRAA